MLGRKAIRKHGMSIHQKEFIQSRGVPKRIGKLRMAGITKHLDVDSIVNVEVDEAALVQYNYERHGRSTTLQQIIPYKVWHFDYETIIGLVWT